MDEDVNAFISSSSPHVRRPTGSGRINRNLHPDSELRRSNGQTRFVPVQHPKLTLYRLSIVLLTAGFGTSKALSAYRGHSSTPTTLEWVYGVVLTIAFYWVGLYEDNPPPQMMWLFDKDYSFDVLRATRTRMYPPSSMIYLLTFTSSENVSHLNCHGHCINPHMVRCSIRAILLRL
ncbi:hypothetical protein BD410DRAFT_290972 [Rickenella mellea]|uniref:Uncharacterized protein n=1 Tax=Rickenella mellea TaxID=50990 RepID=A0A4Y7PFU7_9AGAM|nr:hypothetical protein BD410DRAFT_290972 [Rickenella mellea]